MLLLFYKNKKRVDPELSTLNKLANKDGNPFTVSNQKTFLLLSPARLQCIEISQKRFINVFIKLLYIDYIVILFFLQDVIHCIAYKNRYGC